MCFMTVCFLWPEFCWRNKTDTVFKAKDKKVPIVSHYHVFSLMFSFISGLGDMCH